MQATVSERHETKDIELGPSVKGILCEVPFFGGSALLLFYTLKYINV